MTYLSNKATPSGDYIAQRDDIKLNFNPDLIDQVFTASNLKRVWQQVRANKGAAGVDGMKIDHFLE